MYGLLPNKTKATYRRFWLATLNLFGNEQPSPATLLTDFEPGAYLTAKETYPQVTLRGCYFHLGQAVDRNVAGLGLRAKYSQDGNFKLRVKSLPAIAFFKVADAIPAFEHLKMLFQGDEMQLVSYFERTYIGAVRAGGNGRRAPLFPTPFWNVRGRCDSGFLRTNNAAEGPRQGFANSMVCADHPNMWRFLTALKRQQALTRLDVASVMVGNEKKPGRAQRERNDRILTLMAEYTSGGNDVPKTLRGIAYNYM